MKKGWNIILMIVLAVVVLGAVCMGVGFITGADTARIYPCWMTIQPHAVQRLYHSGAHPGLSGGRRVLRANTITPRRFYDRRGVCISAFYYQAARVTCGICAGIPRILRRFR